MCKHCDYNSKDCKIFIDSLTKDWYFSLNTGEWDPIDNDNVFERVYLYENRCPFCGRYLTPQYFNFNYEIRKYEEIAGPMHDHYTYDSKMNCWYEDILVGNRGYTYKEIQEIEWYE